MTRRAWLLFILSSVIWGVPYLFIKIAVDAGIAPAFIAWSRIALAAALLLPLAIRRKVLQGLRERTAAIIGYTACEVAVPFILISIGEQYITSSLTAILVATMPLMVALLSLRLIPGEHLSGKRLIGLLIGFAGVVALLGFDVAGRATELLGAALVLVATLGYAIAPIIVSRRLSDLDPLGPVTASLLIATVALLPPAIATFPGQLPSVSALIAIAVLGIICTAAGLLVFFRLIAEAGPSRASVITYVNPLVAVIVGVVTLGERLSLVSVAGLGLILVGSWVSTGGSHP
ncbi:MAG: EamA/RhaT family transporter [Gemmatimonadetes bacterium]|nr:MAG: EamA/RhaT family transporter [Gemmatimonadota bacterium]